MPIATVHDAIASIHAGIIADYLLARLQGESLTLADIQDRAGRLDAKHGGDLVAQLDALRSSQAA